MLAPKTTFAAVALLGISIAAPPALAADTSRPPDPCDKELSINDVDGILTGKAKITHYSMSESKPGEGCELGVSGNGIAFVDISIRKGDAQSFKNLLFFVTPSHKSLGGVGDEAYVVPTTDSNIPNAWETDLYARKGGLQCIVELHRSKGAGEKLVIPAGDDAVAAKIGSLCSKLFTARAGL
ncbi:MAG TPA: hypothetical protein VH023_03335 [Rhodopila sp.]|jgi:hypothetical protein|nr:hypothetical protein [Rhodopila sp.]